MFRELAIRGPSGAILWGYRTAAIVDRWTVKRSRVQGARVWTLTGTVAHASPFELRQTGLHFSAPRQGGFFLWPLLEAPRLDGARLTVTVGPPEQ